MKTIPEEEQFNIIEETINSVHPIPSKEIIGTYLKLLRRKPSPSIIFLGIFTDGTQELIRKGSSPDDVVCFVLDTDFNMVNSKGAVLGIPSENSHGYLRYNNVRDILSQKGASNWGWFLEAASFGDCMKLKGLVVAEGDANLIRRVGTGIADLPQFRDTSRLWIQYDATLDDCGSMITPLHDTIDLVESKDSKVVRDDYTMKSYLLGAASPEAANRRDRGDTPLHVFAARWTYNGDREALRFADLILKDKRGRTPLQVYRGTKRKEVNLVGALTNEKYRLYYDYLALQILSQAPSQEADLFSAWWDFDPDCEQGPTFEQFAAEHPLPVSFLETG
ncbi:hypothetical protein BU23DRAFT_604197 [Bimuria novae-zelandiae CBS 107.79]|uniref:Uncharacterized protein n=1 Tax=Bimuria novae-zelandiae CBS 107.79 TaxID=1447943 RepID=A0A6A5UNN3_9PLEO|nr:hypothetical protein BU23DRAFT_604197 [Bimuria novae-zelandiae CBS 107.79]